MRPGNRALASFAALVLITLLTAPHAAADTSSGLPTGKRQHKPFVLTKNPAAYRTGAQRLKDGGQRRAALKLIDALQTMKRRHVRQRTSRARQPNQSDTEFLRGRARRSAKGGGDVAMEELTISHEGLTLVKSSYDRLRRSLGIRTKCVQTCEARKRRCEGTCRDRRKCACVVAASDCLLSEIQARRCSTAMERGWPSKIKSPLK